MHAAAAEGAAPTPNDAVALPSVQTRPMIDADHFTMSGKQDRL